MGFYAIIPAMTQRTSLSRIAAILLAAAALAACGQAPVAQSAAAPSASATPSVTPATIGAPEPTSPEDGSSFIDSNVTLKWSWPPGLQQDQTYAVHLWVDQQPAQEIWTTDPQLNVQQAIDGFNQDVGTYHWQVVVIHATAAQGFIGTVSEWSPVQTINRVRHISPTPRPDAELSNTARLLKSQHFKDTDALVDYARNFIYTYSDYESKPEPGKPDRSDTLEKMYQYYKGNGAPPAVECSARATAMLTLLGELGIDSRLIFLYEQAGESIAQHTELEVFNPDSQRWEITDPTYNVYFIDANSGARSSIAQLVFAPPDATRPCDGCNAADAAKASAHFQAYRIGYTNTFYVNPDRFDVSHRFKNEKDRNLAEFLSGNASDFTFMFAPPPEN